MESTDNSNGRPEPADREVYDRSFELIRSIVANLGDVPQAERPAVLLARLPDLPLQFVAQGVRDDTHHPLATVTSMMDYIRGDGFVEHGSNEEIKQLGDRLIAACVLELARRRGLLVEQTRPWPQSEKLEFSFRHPLANRLYRYLLEQAGTGEPLPPLARLVATEIGTKEDLAIDPPMVNWTPEMLSTYMFMELSLEECSRLIQDITAELSPEGQQELLSEFEWTKQQRLLGDEAGHAE